MSNEELVESVLRLADADPDLTDDAKLVVLAALESDALLAEAIAGEADTPKLPPPPPSGGQAAREPVGAFLKAIRVKGFRGVGPEATLPLHPATGLTVVCGRNGSGKSSFAEAFELALTGESYRWKEKKTVRWEEHWRNIHDGSPCSIRVELAEEGAGVTIIGLDWAGDTDCPVCGVGRLDAEWRARIDAELSDEDEQLVVLRKTRQQLIERRRTAQEVVGRVGPFVQSDQIELSTLAEAQTMLELWTRPPVGDLALADHLELAHDGLEAATTALREEAAALLADRENAWAPLAAQLARWTSLAREARSREPRVKTVKRAGEWLKNNAGQLRRERLAPLSRYAKEIWAALRQESNVDLGTITLEGQGNRRHVDLRAEVDGEQAGALGVMSQGELHVLALAVVSSARHNC